MININISAHATQEHADTHIAAKLPLINKMGSQHECKCHIFCELSSEIRYERELWENFEDES